MKGIHIYKDAGQFLFGKDHADSINNKVAIKKYSNYYLLLITLLFCIIIALFTPNYFQPFTHYIKLVQGGTLRWIGEHQATIIYDNIGYMLMLLIVIIYLMFVKIKIHIKDLLMLLGLTYLSISSYRHISLFLIIGSFTFDTLFSDYFNIYAKKTYQLLIKIIAKPLIYSIIIIFTIALCSFTYIYNIKDQKYISDIYPVEAAEFINKNIDKENMYLYNDYDYGSYLIYKDIKVFIDSRASLYTKQFSGFDRDIADDWRNVSLTGNYKKIFKIYNINYALVSKNSIMDKSLRLDDDYEIIYQDTKFVLFNKITDQYK